MKIIDSKTYISQNSSIKKFDPNLHETVKNIIDDISLNGASACVKYTKQFDKIDLNTDNLVINPQEIDIENEISKDFKESISHAIQNIRRFHKHQKPKNFKLKLGVNGIAGENWIPLDHVGCYIPGGTAPLVSTTMMTVIPAKIASVKNITVATPPQSNGQINPHIIYVCKLLGVNQILTLGGIQAIAALAFGIGVSKVNKIVGPGNRYVTEAKRQLYGIVDIDMLAGPSEVCILADKCAKPEFIAADLLSQVEHDTNALGVVISTSKEILEKTILEINIQKPVLGRQEILEKSFNNLKFVFEPNLNEAIKLVDLFAPEHLEIMLKNSDSLIKYPFKAGAIFVGHYTPVAVGDFYGGTNHVLPTEKRANFSSPLSVYDFLRRSHYIRYDEKTLKSKSRHIEILAETEKLPAHKNSVSIRLNKK